MARMTYRIEIAKRARVLELHSEAGLLKRHAIVLGSNPDAQKTVEGDGATPTGNFYVCAKNPRSKFFLSLAVSYPDAEAAERGLRDGLIDLREHTQIMEALRLRTMPLQHTRLGGEIYIHGHPSQGTPDVSRPDWTRGCIALDNAAMQDLYDRVELGTPVIIRP
jgi:murein L,D-transpeptidase YafK